MFISKAGMSWLGFFYAHQEKRRKNPIKFLQWLSQFYIFPVIVCERKD